MLWTSVCLSAVCNSKCILWVIAYFQANHQESSGAHCCFPAEMLFNLVLVPDGSQTLKGLEIHCEEARLCVCAERKDTAGVTWKTPFPWAVCPSRPAHPTLIFTSYPRLHIPPCFCTLPSSLHPTFVSTSHPCLYILPSFSATQLFILLGISPGTAPEWCAWLSLLP